MELPTPKNADTPKEKKHREQLIVLGTLVLVILTFMLVVRRGQDGGAAPVTSDTSGFEPNDGTGGGTSDPLGTLPLQIGSVPGQTAALEQGQFDALRRLITAQGKRIRAINKRETVAQRRARREAATIKRLRAELHPHHHKHPTHPHRQIPVTHHAPVVRRPTGHKGTPYHPPTHH